jgi:DNA-directed RNA polymerase subunit RPC12/RpoP
VAGDQDLFFGRIAVNRKYCTQDQVERCRILQANSRDRVPLGQLLRSEGYITEEQHDAILTMQRRSLLPFDPSNRVSKQSILIGKLAVSQKLLAESDVNACLRIEAQERGKRTLGEIMIAEGYIVASELASLLAKQERRTMGCASCSLTFTVLSMSKTKVAHCPRCKSVLRDVKPKAKVDAQIETSVSHKILKDNAQKVRPNPPVTAKASPSASVRMVSMTCPMCSKPFCEPVDSKGRVDCPHCFSSFSG